MDEASVGWRILGDWGTSRLRLFRVEAGQIVDRVDAAGIGQLTASPAATLTDALAAWRAGGPPDDILLCGMAGARDGLIEAGYVACPITLDTWRLQVVSVVVDGLTVKVAPGLSCRDMRGFGDVMRGEETQIFGAMTYDSSLGRSARGLVLPGTHSKWVQLDHGVISDFRTFPTGELFALLSERSTLATGNDDNQFDQGFADGLSRAGEPLLGALFTARVGQLLEARSAGWAKGYLSGLLIGGEVAAAVGDAVSVTLIGEPALCARYAVALKRMSIASEMIDGDAAVLAGLALLGSAGG